MLKHYVSFIALAFVLLFLPAKLYAQDTANEKEIIRFRYNRGHIYVPVVLNDSLRYAFLFDTGAPSALYFDRTYYHQSSLKDIPVKKVGIAKLSGIGEMAQRIPIIQDTLNYQIDSINFQSYSTPILELRPIIGSGVGGIVGLAALTKFSIEIRYDKRVIILHQNGSFKPDQTYKKHPLELKNGYLYATLNIEINKGVFIPGKYLIDTGSSGSFYFTSPTTKKHKLYEEMKNKAEFCGSELGAGGFSSGFDFKPYTCKVGGYTYRNLLLSASMDTEGVGASTDFEGLVGNRFLQQFTVVLDTNEGCIYLKERPFSGGFEQTYAGFGYVDRTDICDGWIVNNLYRSCNAENAGLKLNDTITHINKKSVRYISDKESDRIFSEIYAEVTLNVLRNGTITPITYMLTPILKE